METMTEVADTVWSSSKNGHNIPQLVDDPEFPVTFYDWASFFKKYYKPIPSLKQYHHFRYLINKYLNCFKIVCKITLIRCLYAQIE